ncbi:MAG: ATP-binding protein [Alphaproteobacteria bacterium]
MSVAGLDEERFKEILRTTLTPAKAISDPQYLRGRANKLQQIERAFNSPGKHIFIFGDRGIGKTSLAQSAAVQRQSSENEPIGIACDQGAGFFQLMRALIVRCLPPQDLIQKRKSTLGAKIGVPGLSAEASRSIEQAQVPPLESINDVINVLSYVVKLHSREPVAIIDEFDQLHDPKDRKYFADLIKQISDQGIGLRLILCGIGSSLDELIGTHLSTGRYLAPIELERLHHDALWEIITSAADALGLQVEREHLIRIGQISDGFPYYVHLIGEMMFWSVFDDSRAIRKCASKHFHDGVKKGVDEAQASLKLAYEKATQKYSDDYQEVLWAVAENVTFRRQVSDIYENSYLPIMKHRQGRTVLDKDKFRFRLINLKGPRHGAILEAKGAGWYQFRENIVRGYVRLRAEEQDIKLGTDHY